MRAIFTIVLVMVLLAACKPGLPMSPAASAATQIVPEAGSSLKQAAVGAIPAKTAAPEVTSLPTGPHAPQINNTVWLNTKPLTPDQLDGKVVLIDFWTFDCINCINTIPAVRQLYQQYRDRGLIIIGVHSPEFQHERDLNNVKDAVARLDVPYPVALDNDFATWNAFGNHYWPAIYLIDKRGIIRYNSIGELHQNTAAWSEVTGLIETLLKE